MRIWQKKVFLARHTGIPIDTMGGMSCRFFNNLVKEVDYQVRSERYLDRSLMASLIAMVSAMAGSKLKPEDIIGPEPERTVYKEDVQMDEVYTVTLGDGKEYTLAPLNVNIMEDIEEEFGNTWEALFENTPRAKVIKAVIFHMLKPTCPNITRDEVGVLVTTKVLPAITKIIADMV